MRLTATRRLVLAVAALGSGCIYDANGTGRADVYWTFWSHSLGNIGAFTDTATLVCTKGAVDDVRITLGIPNAADVDALCAAGDVEAIRGALVDPAGGPPVRLTEPCITVSDIPGAALVGLAQGRWGYVLSARRGGATVFEAAGCFRVTASERIGVDVRARPPPGNWDVIASYATGHCADGDRLDFDLVGTDGATAVKAFSTRDPTVNPPVVIPCGSGSFTIPSVAPGPYEFTDWVQVDAAGTSFSAFSTCRQAWTQTNAGDTTTAVVDVTASGPSPVGNAGICP